MKVLYVSNSVKTYSLAYQNELPQITSLGHTLVWAANFDGFIGDRAMDIPFETRHIDIHTSPFHKENRKAYRQVVALLREGGFDALVCTTPIGGLIGRLAARRVGIRRVVYAAHGFLFFRGAPLINRTLYKWQEHWMARMTDAIITITREDHEAACRMKLRRGGQVYLVHGAGVDIGAAPSVDRAAVRSSLGLPEEAYALLSAGFLNKNKNHAVVLRAIHACDDRCLHYIICGEGEERERLMRLADELGLRERVHLLGYRTDLPSIVAACDAFVMPSFREGVPRALLEAMDAGLVCIGSDTRGIRELIGDRGEGGVLCDPYDPASFARGIARVRAMSCEELACIRARNRAHVHAYSSQTVRNELHDVYKDCLPL